MNKTDPTLGDLVEQVSNLSTATADLLEATNVSKDKIEAAVPSAEQAIKSAAEALADANRADAAADRTEEISGIETVQDALRLAAVPLPDFHLPLNDNLTIREGVGTPYQEGLPLYKADFARASKATYINKAGQLVEAAVNEPRFEKEGILIEGASTNLFRRSSQPLNWEINGGAYTIKEHSMGGITVGAVTAKKDGESYPSVAGYLGVTPSLKAGDFMTASAVVKKTSDAQRFRFRFSKGEDGGFVGDCVIDTMNMTSTREIKVVELSDGYFKVSYLFAAVHDGVTRLNIGYEMKKNSVTHVGCFQLETLPFASSYIPTEGTTVTRAAERIEVQFSGNVTSLDRTITSEVSLLGKYETGANARRHVYSATGNPNCFFNGYLYDSVDGNMRKIAALDGNSGSDCSFNIETTTGIGAYRKSDDVFDLWWNGNKSNSLSRTKEQGFLNFYLGSQYGTARYLWGHLKNFRIWHKALTDEQIAALGGA